MNTRHKISRRRFLCGSTGALAACAASGVLHSAARAAGQPPNVVYIVCDQMRGDAMSCLGSPNARTPNLDRMAAGGALFERCFVSNPVCVPSRISAFTGRYPHQHGTLSNVSASFLKEFEGTLLGHFRDRGYRLGWVGKNHTFAKGILDDSHIRAREPFRKYNAKSLPWWHADMEWPADRCFASTNTRDSIRFIRDAKPDEPYFLHVSYFDPHPPYFAPAETAERYKAADMHLPDYVPAEKLSARLDEHGRAMRYGDMTPETIIDTMRYYYASIEWGVDKQVGLILDTLERTGQTENTIVVFTSDHGDFMGHHGMVRKGMFLYDDLLHVPLIYYAPGRIPPGRRLGGLAQGVDLLPTLADLTGGDIPEGLAGVSLAPQLRGEFQGDPDRTIFASCGYADLPDDFFETWREPRGNEPPRHSQVLDLTCEAKSRTIMARTRDWKLILSETRPPELYAMEGGTVERENVAGRPETAEIQRRLEAEIRGTWTW